MLRMFVIWALEVVVVVVLISYRQLEQIYRWQRDVQNAEQWI